MPSRNTSASCSPSPSPSLDCSRDASTSKQTPYAASIDKTHYFDDDHHRLNSSFHRNGVVQGPRQPAIPASAYIPPQKPNQQQQQLVIETDILPGDESSHFSPTHSYLSSAPSNFSSIPSHSQSHLSHPSSHLSPQSWHPAHHPFPLAYKSQKSSFVVPDALDPRSRTSSRPTTSPASPTSDSRRHSHQVISVYSDPHSDDDEEERSPSVGDIARSMLHLAFTAVLLSIILFFYTFAVLLVTTISSPMWVWMKSQPSLARKIRQYLRSPLNMHRRCIALPSVEFASPDTLPSFRAGSTLSQSSRTILCRSGTPVGPIITTLLLAPIVAIPIAVSAWVMGAAWLLGAIVSDEEAGDERDERRLSQKVISWWASWLDRGVEKEREDVHGRGRQRERRRERREMREKDAVMV